MEIEGINNLEVFYVLGNNFIINEKKRFSEIVKSNKRKKRNNNVDKKEITDFINCIIAWYSIKFPDEQLLMRGNKLELINHEYVDNSDIMTIKELRKRISSTMNMALKCNYHGRWGVFNEYDEDVLNEYDRNQLVFLEIRNKKERQYTIITARNDGRLVGKGPIFLNKDIRSNYDCLTIDTLLDKLDEQNNKNLIYKDIRDCVNRHNRDIAIREYMIRMIILGLLYSDKTSPEYGYFRAKQFIKDFNKEYDLKISDEYLNGIMTREYSSDSDEYKKALANVKSNEKKNTKRRFLSKYRK